MSFCYSLSTHPSVLNRHYVILSKPTPLSLSVFMLFCLKTSLHPYLSLCYSVSKRPSVPICPYVILSQNVPMSLSVPMLFCLKTSLRHYPSLCYSVSKRSSVPICHYVILSQNVPLSLSVIMSFCLNLPPLSLSVFMLFCLKTSLRPYLSSCYSVSRHPSVPIRHYVILSQNVLLILIIRCLNRSVYTKKTGINVDRLENNLYLCTRKIVIITGY